MRKIIVAAALILVLPSSSFAWGAAAHKFIMRRALDLLPVEIKPFFLAHSDELVIRVNDPDLWRTAGWEDDPNHFLNFGVPEFGPYPFAALPREYGAAIEKFGTATLKRDGTLPWRAVEEFGNLRRAFEGFNQSLGFAPGNAVLFSAVAAHYVQDASQPLHASVNYDGQLTGQFGVHSRFESALVERFGKQLTIRPVAAAPISNPRDAVFDILLASYKAVDPILAADKAAIGSKDTYDDEYFQRFFDGVKPILDERLTAAIEQTAAFITGAWEAAGRPQLRDEMPRRVQKVRPPKG